MESQYDRFYQEVSKAPDTNLYQVIVVYFKDDENPLVLMKSPIDSEGFYINREPKNNLLKVLMGSACSYGSVAGEMLERSKDNSRYPVSPEFHITEIQSESAAVFGREILHMLQEEDSPLLNIPGYDHLIARLAYLLIEKE